MAAKKSTVPTGTNVVKNVFQRSYNSTKTGYSYLMELENGFIGLFSSLSKFETSDLIGKEVFFEVSDLESTRTIEGKTQNVSVCWNLSLTENGDLLDYQENKDVAINKAVEKEVSGEVNMVLNILAKADQQLVANIGISYSDIAASIRDAKAKATSKRIA